MIFKHTYGRTCQFSMTYLREIKHKDSKKPKHYLPLTVIAIELNSADSNG